MDRFMEMQVFIRIAERKSFTQAADDLQIPRATVTNLMKRMEERLGTRLLERTTRTVRLTHDGEAYYRRCVRLVADMEEAEGSFRHVAPKGLLRANLQGTLARHFVAPALPAFIARYPDIELQIGEDDRLVDLVREGIDCVVRAGSPKDSSLVARRLAVMPEVICASAQYLQRFGMPQHPDELSAHQAVGFFSSSHDRSYPFELIVDGQVREFAPGGWISVNDAESYVTCALHGCGLIQLPRFHVEDELRDGRLVEVLADWSGTGMPVSAMYPQHRQLSPRVRVFIDWIAAVYEERFGTSAQ